MFDDLVERAFAALWDLHPASAVYLGKHEYDGVVPDWSEEHVAAVLGRLDGVLAELQGADLDGDDALDRDQLAAAIEAELFDRRVLRTAERNPMAWVYALDPDLYLKRHYAPAAERAAVVTRMLEAAPAFLDLARRRIDPVIPRTLCEWGVIAAEGLADLVRNDVLPAFGDAAGPGLEAAVASGDAALMDFARWIREERLPAADDGHAIGAAAMEELLRVNEMVSMPLARLKALAESDLKANLAAFRATADQIDPGADPGDVYRRHVASVHPAADELIPSTAAMLEDIRSFLIDHDIVTVPSEVRARVTETPRHLRWAFAMMDTPGPYEKVATDAYYYVTPVDEAWDDEEAEEWLRALNTFAMEDISIHEAYPGHYVQFLHFQSAPTEVSRRLVSYAFAEGWAHYAEEMMWEEGYRDGDPRFRLAQLSEALVRNCRFVCAIAIHAEGMSVDEATRFFVENAFYEEVAARKEAERGTFDPGYFSYTLGKVQIKALRDDVRAARGDAFALKAFHDDLLSRGAPPVGLMRRVLLG